MNAELLVRGNATFLELMSMSQAAAGPAGRERALLLVPEMPGAPAVDAMAHRRRLRAVAAHLVTARLAAAESAETAVEAESDAEAELYFFPGSDRSILPSLTNDMAQAKRDIDVFGYCLWADALSEEEVATMAKRVVAQAEAEVREGQAKDGATHFIGSIVNKGEEFEPLLTHPVATELLTHMLGEHYNLSTGFGARQPS
jgi:hypothetical protein